MADGSVSASVMRVSPAHTPVSTSCFWASLPASSTVRPPSTTVDASGTRHQRAAGLLQQDRQVHEVAAGAAVLLGEGQAGPAQADHLPPQVVGVAALVLFHLAHQGQRAFLGQELAGAALQHLLDFGESQVHFIPRISSLAVDTAPSRRSASIDQRKNPPQQRCVSGQRPSGRNSGESTILPSWTCHPDPRRRELLWFCIDPNSPLYGMVFSRRSYNDSRRQP